MDTCYREIGVCQLISIIMPVFNAEKTVQGAIESVLVQDYSYWELIIIDDGSLDLSGAICDKWSARDSRIKVHHLVNRGVSAARNYGLSCAQGELICFIDSDDKMRSGALQKIVESSTDSDLLIFGYNIYPNNIKLGFADTKYYSSLMQFADDFKRIHKNHLLNCVWNKCFKKNLIEKYQCTFPVEISMGEDLLFVLDYFKGCNNIRIINDILYDYNVENSESLSRKYRLDSFSMQKKLKEITDKTFNGNREVMETTSYIFVNHIIEEMKKIVLSQELNRTTKLEYVKNWMKNPYFRDNFDLVKQTISQNFVKRFIISNNKPYWFYLYCLSIKFGSKVKQRILLRI